MLLLTVEVQEAMIAHAVRELPLEACGMFSTAGDGDVVDRFHPLRNAAASATTFELDGQQMLDLEREIDSVGRHLVGVMHSHPTTVAYPSPTDLAAIGRFDPYAVFHHVIVSLRDDVPQMRSFRVPEGRVVEDSVVLVEPLSDRGTTPGS